MQNKENQGCETDYITDTNIFVMDYISFYAADLDDTDLTSSCGRYSFLHRKQGPFFENKTTASYVRTDSLRETKNKFATRRITRSCVSFKVSILCLALAVPLSPNLHRVIYHRPIDRPPASIEKLPSTQ